MLLKNTLQANACFSLICGVTLLLLPSTIAGLLGQVPVWLLIVLGVGLTAFAVDVYWISRQLPRARVRAQIIFLADVAWVVLTPLVLWLFAAELSKTGVMLLIEIAVIVGLFALVEWKGLQQLRRTV